MGPRRSQGDANPADALTKHLSLGQARCGLVAEEAGRASGFGAKGAVVVGIYSVSVCFLLSAS